ncbi:MAG: hypothetical protein ACO3GM_00805 [Candidatus Limnocylindrus sp.]
MSTLDSIVGAIGATIAAVSGLSSAKVVRGSPVDTLRGQPTAPACYLWVEPPVELTAGATSRLYTVRATVGWYLSATATAGSTGAMEAGALDLLSLVSAAVLADPSCGGYAHAVERLGMTANGTLPGAGPNADTAGCWLAGTLTVRYESTGAL